MKRTRRKSVPSEGTRSAVSKPQRLADDTTAVAIADAEQEDCDRTTFIPNVQRLMASDWYGILPLEVATGFVGVSIGLYHGRNGQLLWDDMMDFIGEVLAVEPGPEEKPVVDFIIKRFKDYYGEYERTPEYILRVLADLGLIVISEVDGEKTFEIPAVLPSAEERLGLCMVDVDEKVVFKARYRNDAGPRQRVTYDDVPAIRRMLNAGWARHLPPDLSYAFMAAAGVAVSKCTGDLMWDNIEDLWKAQREHKNPLMPKRKAAEVEARFLEEYGRQFTHTARGCIDVLLDIGLLVKKRLRGEDFLDVPKIIPTPDMRLFLSETEKEILAERLKIEI